MIIKEEIFGWFGEYHQAVYRDILSEVESGDNILEIGCLLGKSTHYLSSIIKERGATIYCCDLWESMTASAVEKHCADFEMRYGKDLYPEFKKNLQEFDFIKAYKMSSTQFFNCLLGKDIKFKRIYLDGSHEYDIVRTDIINSIMCVTEDGIIAGDDYTIPGVSRAVRDVLGNADITYCGERQWIFDIAKNKDIYKNIRNAEIR